MFSDEGTYVADTGCRHCMTFGVASAIRLPVLETRHTVVAGPTKALLPGSVAG